MSEVLPPQYDPSKVEGPLYQEWLDKGYFEARTKPVLNGDKSPYTIMIPPPNVTSALHMGHGLNNTLQDLLIRWRRMQGFEALWLPGTDHAGIATQNVVERGLLQEGRTRYDVGRQEFVQHVWDWVDQTGFTILEQLRAIGSSCDWSRTRFTLDDGLSSAVREVFVRLYEKELIYRDEYIINWCPRCLTALSDEEAEVAEKDARLYHLRYPLSEACGELEPGLPKLPDGRRYLVVATTRPETMLGDTGVAVHPDDERYRRLVGAQVELPLTDRRLRVVADDFVDPQFGSGVVKITPAHDQNDFEAGCRHGLPTINVLTPEARMNDNSPPELRGMDRYEARRRVLHLLGEQDLLERVEDHRHGVPHCYRCNTAVEPRLSLQWFVRMKPLAEPALAASRDGRLRFRPERWTKVYEDWLENIRDWCISRQLWWGHRIPVWYCQSQGCQQVIVAREDPTSCPACGQAELQQDPDVLDTWFSSWLWPFSTLGWPEETDDLKAFYPTNTLVTGPDIIFFWVARMVMAGLEFRGEVPFRDVYLNGIVRDHRGRKMSKSLGNGIDPLEVVSRFGADALRYTVVAGAGAGTDLFLNYEDLEGAFAPGRNFANKIWNAGRFALLNLPEHHVTPVDDLVESLELADRWILSRLHKAVEETTARLEGFRIQEAAELVYHFFWGELADWYLELVKPRLQGDGGEVSRTAAQATLVEVLDGVLRLLHPFVPFISESLWKRLPAVAGKTRPDSLVIASWPEPVAGRRDPEVEAQFGALMELIGAVRTLRSEYGVKPSQQLGIKLAAVPEPLRRALEVEERALRRLARVETVDYASADGGVGAHAVLASGAELFVPLAGIIDVEQERQRLANELAQLEHRLNDAESKLRNESFVSRAPADVVERARARARLIREQRGRLSEKLKALR